MAAGPRASCARTRAGHTLAFPSRRPEDTVLHRTLRGGLETFLARADQVGRPIPPFAVRELRAYLGCGLLPFGFPADRGFGDLGQCGVVELELAARDVVVVQAATFEQPLEPAHPLRGPPSDRA